MLGCNTPHFRPPISPKHPGPQPNPFRSSQYSITKPSRLPKHRSSLGLTYKRMRYEDGFRHRDSLRKDAEKSHRQDTMLTGRSRGDPMFDALTDRLSEQRMCHHLGANLHLQDGAEITTTRKMQRMRDRKWYSV